MPTRPASTTDGPTRRQLLKRGVALGVATMWATPTLQLVRMSRAQAADASGSNCVIYCIKFDWDTQQWEHLGNGVQNCLTCPTDGINGLPPQELLDLFTVSGDPEVSVTVRYPSTCSLLVLDSTPDEMTGLTTGAAKCASGPFSCSFVGPEDQTPDTDPDFQLLEIPVCANGRGISHIELIIQCCDHDMSA
jgi:hypothetical protein